MQVWDIRTKANVHTLTGHTNTVATVRCQAAEPQIITGTIMFFQIVHNSSINPSVRQALKWFLFTLAPNVCLVCAGSHDSTIRLWDLIAGKTRATLTNHKKSVRTLVLHPRQ